jgi:hypothetical protein
MEMRGLAEGVYYLEVNGISRREVLRVAVVH